ncbi:ASCH domain-containing protein [Serratia fonticola]|uniref:ASCH domain-containing protein n=1 Tax=Serratia fonticola TaxID=47917 RepID=UPI0021BB5375|nr:ASCH domain-containing protein [Serratia fonticola]
MGIGKHRFRCRRHRDNGHFAGGLACTLSAAKREITRKGKVTVYAVTLAKITSLRFCDVTDELAKKEDEEDLSLRYWKQGHKEFFQREGSYSDTMELVTE